MTVSLDVTQRVRPPRAVFVPFRMGHHFGVPFHRDLQRHILLQMLDLLYTAERSGVVRELPITWAQARREGIEIERRLGLRDG